VLKEEVVVFTDAENRALRDLAQGIIWSPLPLDHQECQAEGNFRWCADWWTIEICKFFFLGERVYMDEKPPRRLQYNPLFSKEFVQRTAGMKLDMLSALRSQPTLSGTLVVCEAGRGADILLASFVKKWDRIVAYDNSPYVVAVTLPYFRDKLLLPIEYEHTSTERFKVPEGDYVILANITRHSKEDWKLLVDKPGVYGVRNGTPGF